MRGFELKLPSRALQLGVAAGAMLAAAGCTALPAVLTGVAGVATAVANDTTGTLSSVSSAVATDATVASDATPTVAALVSDVKGIVADGVTSLTPAQVTQVDGYVDQLSAYASQVQPSSTGSELSGFLGDAETAIKDIGAVLPDVLPLLALVDNEKVIEPVRIVHVAMVADGSAKKVVHSDPAKIASLMKHLKALKSIAAAKLAAGK